MPIRISLLDSWPVPHALRGGYEDHVTVLHRLNTAIPTWQNCKLRRLQNLLPFQFTVLLKAFSLWSFASLSLSLSLSAHDTSIVSSCAICKLIKLSLSLSLLVQRRSPRCAAEPGKKTIGDGWFASAQPPHK